MTASKSEYTRRQFVQTSAAAAAGGAFLAPKIATGRVSRLESIKVGLIGCGGRGTGAAMQALKADPNAILTAMCDAFPDRIEGSLGNLAKNEAIADKLLVTDTDKYSGFDGYQGLIDSGVDVVCLATPPVFRPAHLRYAIQADKHVFCEKPVAVDAPGVRSVLETSEMAAQKGLTLVSGFCWRYNLGQRAFWEQVNSGRLGQVQSMVTTYNTGPLGDYARKPGESDMEWQLRNWKAFIWSSGDHIVEQAIHAIDWMHWAMNGELPVKAMAVGGRQCRTGEWTGNIYDHFSVVYEWADGARGQHMCRQIPNCDGSNDAFVIGTEGQGFSNPWNSRSLRIEGANPWRYTGPNNDMYQQEHDEMFAAIRAGAPINNGQRMSESTMMGIMGRECAYTGRNLTYEKCLNSTKSLTPETWSWGDRAFPAVPMPSETEPV